VQHRQLNESLLAGDLRMLVDNIFEVDSYASKMGDDKDVVVISFTVDSLEPANDLVEFIEKGYDFVLDADKSPGELSDGKYKVFVEIERNTRIAEQIIEMLTGVKQLAEVEDFKFRYYKSFNSIDATEEALKETIPNSKQDYEVNIQENSMNNFSNFFNRSYLESLSVDQDDLVFRKKYAEPLRMRIKGFGKQREVYESVKGPIMLESKDMSEILFFTKYIGNYNITKIGSSFVFENQGYALVLEKV
jgi:hypothetical protein